MNFKRYKIGLLIMALFMIAPACDDGFEEINTDPTVATAIAPNYQFSWVLLRTSGGRYENWRARLIYSSTMIQHFATTCGYWTGDKYTYNAGYAASLFDRGYSESVKDIQDLINTLEKGEVGDPTMLAMAKIWRVVIFQRMTDMYGDIPYSEAGKALIDGIDFPKYDTQEFIYNDMLKELETAIPMLGSGGFGAADFVYQGDSDKWRRFGNSLMLRLAMRLTERDPALAQEYATKALAGGIMETVDHDAFIEHTNNNGINKNGIGEVLDVNFGADGCPRLSNTMVDWLLANNDPRLDIVGIPAAGVHKGLPNGLDGTTIANNPTGTSVDDFDKINPILVGVVSPMFFMSSAEAQLFAAEASLRGWGGGDAATHYNNGVTNHMKGFAHYGLDPVDDAGIAAYLAANPFDAATGMDQIGWQYWMATLLNDYESYSNWRRTGIPNLTPVNYPGNATGGTIPLRLVYPQSEAGNPSFEASKAAQGLSDDFASYLTVPVWWDAN